MGTRASVELYLCAFRLGKCLTRAERTHITALNIIDDQFRRMHSDDGGALQARRCDDRMYEVAGLDLKTDTEAEKASLRLVLIEEARKAGVRFPA
jgi:hypothetical protein